MPAYQYAPFVDTHSATIAEILARQGDIRARQALTIGEAQARAAEQSGQAWGGAIQNIGQSIAAIPQQIQQAKTHELQSNLLKLKVDEAQRDVAGRRAVASMMQGDQLAPGAVGPRQPSYLDASGLFDISKITQALGQSGYGDIAPDLVKGAEAINTSILNHQKAEQETAQAHTVMLGDLANGALKLTKTGTPLLDAMDFVVQPALATKRIKQDEYLSVRSQIANMPPEQQQAALTTLMDQAAQLGGAKTLAEGATEVDRYGRVITTGKPKPPTRASLAFDLSSDDPIVRARAKAAIAEGFATKRSETDQALDAYAKTLGKTKAEDLTDAERQAYAKRQATITSNQAYFQHTRERQYDIAHPVPEKAKEQDALEQEYRTVLARGLSSRSGGLGLEDAKVQQANHLLALMEQNYNPTTGEYNIPRVQQTELALGLARLVSPSGTVGIQLESELNQRTAKGDLAGIITYVTGQPVTGSTQAIFKMFHDSIQRQGEVAQQNREGEMRYLRGLAPTDLEEPRRTTLEANTLNPLRQSRIIRNTQTGERRLQISTDGGKTWK